MKMLYKKLGNSKIKLSLIGLGAGVFNRNKDPSITLKKAKETIKFAVKNGINFIDMGKEYDEEFISRAMKDVRNKLYVITRSESKTAKEMERDIKDSIKKLKVKPVVYEVMIETVEDFENIVKNGVIDILEEAKLNGKINLIGIFSHKIEVLEKAIRTNRFNVISTLYNAVHRKAEKIFALKSKYKFGFIAAAPFATGILVDPKYDENVHVPGSEFMTPENALKFVLSCKYVDAVIIGMKKKEHIEEVTKIGSKKWKLKKSEKGKIARKFEKFLGFKFCRMCRYCEGCVQDVSVADLLKLLIIAERYKYLNFAKWQLSVFKDKIKNKNFENCEKICPYKLPISKMINKLNELT